jgi:hypothetical protein
LASAANMGMPVEEKSCQVCSTDYKVTSSQIQAPAPIP